MQIINRSSNGNLLIRIDKGLEDTNQGLSRPKFKAIFMIMKHYKNDDEARPKKAQKDVELILAIKLEQGTALQLMRTH